MGRITLLLNIFVALVSTRPPNFDVVSRNGLICDGTGSTCTAGAVAITGGKIAKTGDVSADNEEGKELVTPP